MPHVKDIIAKSNLKPLPVIDESSSVIQALVEMKRLNEGALVVMSKGSVSGMFSERDYARKIVLNNKNSNDTLISEIMTKEVIYVDGEYSLDECMIIMTANEIRHLPVISKSNPTLLGLISMTDIVSCIVESKDFHISQLTQYITGSTSKPRRLWNAV